MSQSELLNKVSAYYSDKIRTHGPTPKGADWRDEHSQHLRFARLLDVVNPEDRTGTISELGCGYGALATYLRNTDRQNTYIGSDISADMIEAARRLHHDTPNTQFELGNEPHASDYVIASGIFNVRFDIPDQEWQAYIDRTIDGMVVKARRGVAFNCLTAYSDRDRMDPRLFYASPGQMLTWCIERYGRHVALRHDYGLYEYTMIIRMVPEDRA